jgi:hypothetical protein
MSNLFDKSLYLQIFSLFLLSLKLNHIFTTMKKYVAHCEDLTAVRMTMLFFWILMPCRFIGIYQSFGQEKHRRTQLKMKGG